jgi:hypothetical protein
LLSSLITGGGDSRRELYSNNREFAFKVMRPVVLNGINIPSDRPDLLERTLIVEVPDIRPEERETEHDLWAKFEEKRGLLLGVVFDLISGVLRNYQPLEKRPRMADWSDYASALYAHTGWGRDQFEADWETEEERQHETALDSIVGSALVDYLRSEFEPPSYKKVPEVLTKTPAALFDSVRVEVNLDARKFFPQSTSSFMRDFNRHIPALEYLGYGI